MQRNITHLIVFGAICCGQVIAQQSTSTKNPTDGSREPAPATKHKKKMPKNRKSETDAPPRTEASQTGSPPCPPDCPPT